MSRYLSTIVFVALFSGLLFSSVFDKRFCEGRSLQTLRSIGKYAFRKSGSTVVYYGGSTINVRVRKTNEITGDGPFKDVDGIPATVFADKKDLHTVRLRPVHLALGITKEKKATVRLAIASTKEVAMAKAEGKPILWSDIKSGLYSGTTVFDPIRENWKKMTDIKLLFSFRKPSTNGVYDYGSTYYRPIELPFVEKPLVFEQIKVTPDCAWLFGSAKAMQHEIEVAIGIKRKDKLKLED